LGKGLHGDGEELAIAVPVVVQEAKTIAGPKAADGAVSLARASLDLEALVPYPRREVTGRIGERLVARRELEPGAGGDDRILGASRGFEQRAAARPGEITHGDSIGAERGSGSERQDELGGVPA